MSLKIQGEIVNIGTYNDNSKEYHIDARGKDLASVMRALDAEDITPADDLSSSVIPESNSGKSLFCRITQAAYDKGVAQQVDDDLRSASVSAPKLVKALNTNDALGYTDTKNLPSTKLFKMLNEHYELSFDVRAFQIARSK